MDVWFEGLSLPVTDLEASIGFYEQLGFVAEIRADRFGLMRYGSGTLGLLAVGAAMAREKEAGGGRLRALVQVEMGTDDLDALHDDLVARRIPIAVPPRDRGFERSMQLRDPDGFTIEFAEGQRGHNSTRER
jgi:catechol 2,3-dioxygenase-like lactoylglutathione lyase family enzyme